MPHLVKQNSQNEARHQHRQPFFRKLMRSSRLRIPGLAERELPLRIRWWLLGFMVLWLGLMAILGFIKFTNGLPLNDKFLHFVCFAVLASLFFLTLDIDDSARRIWYWRHLPSAVTISCCTLCASIASEFIQSLLPFIRQYKEFQTGDVVANVLGSLMGYAISLALDRAHRRRRAISALYAPLSEEPDDDDAQEDEYQEELQQAAFRTPTSTNKHHKRGSIDTIDSLRMANVWDEELFRATDSEEDLCQSSRR